MTRAPFLVLAHHRSGSNFVNDLLQAHPRVECINEPLSMHTGYFRGCDLAPWAKDDFDPELLHRCLAGHGALRSYLLEFREYLLQSNSMHVIGFKETVLFGKLEWLKEFLPPLKILFLKRDPRAIVSSVLRSQLSRLWRYDELVRPVFAAMFPGYLGSAGSAALAAAETVAMSVAVRYELARRSIQLFEHRVLSLEAILRAPEDCLRDLAAFLGVEPHAEQLAFLRRRQGVSRGGAFSSFRTQEDVEHAWKRHLSVEQLDVIEAVLLAARCGPRAAEAAPERRIA